MDKKFEPARKRVFMIAGSDLDMPSSAFGGAPHRLIISDDAIPEPWQEQNLLGWEIRKIHVEPYWRVLIADDHAILTKLDETYKVEGIYFADNSSALNRVIKYFDRLWASAIPYRVVAAAAEVRRESIEIRDPDWRRLIRELATEPSRMRQLNPRKFEDLIAQLLACEGFEVQMTSASRDGGRDILAWPTLHGGRALWLVECKRFAQDRRVDVRMVRALYGVLEAERASCGMLVTTSDFTRPAREFELTLRNRLVMRNYGELAKWLRRIAGRLT